MLKTSVRRGGYVKFRDFQQDSNGNYVCWYLDEIDEYEITKEQLKIEEVSE